MSNSQDQFLDFYRAGLKATGDMLRASLEGAERLRTQQLTAIGEALAAHEQSVAEIGQAKGFEELFAVQAKIAGTQTQAVIGYWNGLWQMAGESQVEINKRVQTQVEQIRDHFLQSLEAAPAGSTPMMQALQSLVQATTSAYTLTARATEEAARLAADQVATANAGIRQAAEQLVQRKSA